MVALISINKFQSAERQKCKTKIESCLELPLVLHLLAKNCCALKSNWLIDGSAQPNKWWQYSPDYNWGNFGQIILTVAWT